VKDSLFAKLQPQKNYMQIARQIRNLIRDGTLMVGDKLPPERHLVAQFGASRASIREALSALEMLGLVECRSGHGNFIKADGSEGTIDGKMLQTLFQDHDPYEIFEARLEIEPPLAALAALRATTEERERLTAQVERLATLGRRIREEGFADPLIEGYMDEDRKYHLEIGRSAHNAVLFTVFSGVNLMMAETHWKAMKSKGLMKEGNLQAYEQEHGAIPAAILGKNPKLAQKELKNHIFKLRRKRDVVAAVAAAAKGKVPIIPGTAACSTREAILLSNDACEAGADFVIVTAPYYFKLPDSSLKAHHVTIARNVGCPVIVYNNPLYKGNPTSPALIAELLKEKNIVGVKQSSVDMGQLIEMIRLAPEGKSLCTGIDSQFYPALCAGASGVYSTAAGVLLISSNLDEVLGVADTLVVMYKGRVVANLANREQITKELIGEYMMGLREAGA